VHTFIKPASHINLFCLPYAGGSATSYRIFSKTTFNHTRFHAVELPGRGVRIKEKCLTNIDLLAEDIISSLEKRLHEPYSFYGHSMGALLAYVATRKIVAKKLDTPVCLFLSACEGPLLYNAQELLQLSDVELVSRLRSYGGTPSLVLEHQELMDFFLPIIRADFSVLGSFTYCSSDPLNLPIELFIGNEDEVTLTEAEVWERETNANFTIRVFKGGHFFIFDHYQKIASIIDRKHGTILNRA